MHYGSGQVRLTHVQLQSLHGRSGASMLCKAKILSQQSFGSFGIRQGPSPLEAGSLFESAAPNVERDPRLSNVAVWNGRFLAVNPSMGRGVSGCDGPQLQICLPCQKAEAAAWTKFCVFMCLHCKRNTTHVHHGCHYAAWAQNLPLAKQKRCRCQVKNGSLVILLT